MRMKRKIISTVLLIILVMLVSASAGTGEKPIVGVAWRSNQESESFVAACKAIEAAESPDKTFALGLQYHPEISVVRENDEASLIYFQAIVDLADKARSCALTPAA